MLDSQKMETYGLEGIGIEKKELVRLPRISTWAIYLQRSEPGGRVS